jgi:uncharacterized protein YcfJ
MTKSMLMGVALGMGVATAGGVAAYQFLGTKAEVQQGSAVVEPETATQDEAAVQTKQAQAAPAPTRSAPTRSAPAPAPRPVAQAPAPVAAAASTDSAPAPCNPDAAPPKDSKRIAGTAIGALVGGAVARDVGDRNLTTAVGAAVGAFAGNKIQQKIQERKASETGTPCAQ